MMLFHLRCDTTSFADQRTDEVQPQLALYNNADDSWIGQSPVRKEIIGLAKYLSSNVTRHKHNAKKYGETPYRNHLRRKVCSKPAPECGCSDPPAIRLAESWVRRY